MKIPSFKKYHAATKAMSPDLLALAVALADECETSVIECACDETPAFGAGQHWYDLSSAHSTNSEEVEWAMVYLRARGLVEVDSKNANHIRLLYDVETPSSRLLCSFRHPEDRRAA